MTSTAPPTSAPTTAKLAVLSVDPAGLTTFHSFDPDSFTVISAVNDALVYIDSEGEVQPALATAWRKISPLELELDLRRGVRFHNGEDFDADCVVATFHAHKHPTPSAGGKGVLGPIVGATRVDTYTVRIRTAFPDAMLLRRLFFSSIYPKSVLDAEGRDGLAPHPIGTGPYRFVSHARGREIVLARNPEHWAGRATVDVLRFPILRQKDWLDHLVRGEVDLALSIDCHDRVRAERLPGIDVRSRAAAISQWFLLAKRGPLADVRVRRALNHAINRSLLVDVTAHGFGAAQRAIATEGQEGHTDCEAYRYSPELSRRLLEEAGHAEGFVLRGLVAETSTAVYFMVREFMARIGVRLEAEIVPRGEWIARVVGGNLGGKPYQGDFALASIDNPILHSLFHHFIFLFSHGPFSLHHDPAYDAEFMAAVTGPDGDDVAVRLARLERYARDEALVLFTITEHVHAAFRPGFSCELPRSGHFQVAALMSVRIAEHATPALSLPSLDADAGDAGLLLDATSHLGTFFLRPGEQLAQPALRKVWTNIVTSEQRWRLEGEPMVRELVSQAEAKVHLSNVLGSTERVAIVGYNAEGRRLFVNRGYESMFGSERSLLELLGARWPAIREEVARGGVWVGSLQLSGVGLPEGLPSRLYLSVTHAVDQEGLAMGHTFVLSDYTGEEERIRHQAIRTILDNVPYALFMCDADARVLEGYSDACQCFFMDAARGIVGRQLPELLGMSERDADHFMACYDQIVADLMPEQVSLGNLPTRIVSGVRTFSLSAAVVRGEAGGVDAVIFTVIDISDLSEAEHEIASLRGAMTVLRFRGRFEEFVLPHHARLCALMREEGSASFEREARRELHTAKGVFAQFGLAELARAIHHIEDAPRLGAADLGRLTDLIRALLAEHEALWGIRLGRAEARYTTSESALSELEDWVASAKTPAEQQARALACLARLREKTAAEWLGPVAEACAELAERRGKRVRVSIAGGELRWPSQLAEVFSVLPHLLRNSIDHGIERPEDRDGKPAEASLSLSFEDSAGQLRICVADDGRGIAVERVAERALALEVVSRGELARMTDAEKLRLIFVGGLSTAAEVSETSGRGVGMDAVEAAVTELGGTIDVHSTRGFGTRFEIAIPR